MLPFQLHRGGHICWIEFRRAAGIDTLCQLRAVCLHDFMIVLRYVQILAAGWAIPHIIGLGANEGISDASRAVVADCAAHAANAILHCAGFKGKLRGFSIAKTSCFFAPHVVMIASGETCHCPVCCSCLICEYNNRVSTFVVAVGGGSPYMPVVMILVYKSVFIRRWARYVASGIAAYNILRGAIYI